MTEYFRLEGFWIRIGKSVPKRTYAMRYIAGRPVERVFSDKINQSDNFSVVNGPLLTSGFLRVMVWNIFKQQRADWLSVLNQFGRNTQLMLLQEAQTTPELVKFATSNYLAADQVPAFVLPQHPSGVMTLSAAYPVYCFPFREQEPLLRLSKSALITVYPLYNELSLMVINIHAINFSFGVDVYRKQLAPIGEQITIHKGPVIMAGDFNTWSRQRVNVLQNFVDSFKLQEVRFIYDHRRRIFGRPLDFIFYRELEVVNASIPITSASDHNPLLVEFYLQSSVLK